MNEQPVFSIIIPTFNRSGLVLRAVDSVLKQTFQNWELIIVDDGSTDDTADVIRPYLTDERIHYLQKENSGAPHSRNVGAEIAKGDFLSFLDSDDAFRPTKLAVENTCINKHGEGYCYYSGFRRFNTYNENFREFVPGEERDLHEKLKNHNPIYNLSNVVIPRNIFQEVGGFDVDFKARQDVELFYRISKRHKFILIKEALVDIYRGPSDRISANSSFRIAGFTAFLEKHKKDFSFNQKSFLAKKIVVLAISNRSFPVAFKYFPLGAFSLIKGIFRTFFVSVGLAKKKSIWN